MVKLFYTGRRRRSRASRQKRLNMPPDAGGEGPKGQSAPRRRKRCLTPQAPPPYTPRASRRRHDPRRRGGVAQLARAEES